MRRGKELRRAAANLLEDIPGLEVQGYFVDFEGVWEAELGTQLLTRLPRGVRLTTSGRDFLDHERAIVKPKAVVALGATAARSLFGAMCATPTMVLIRTMNTVV